MPTNSRKLLAAIFLFGFIGFADAAYLTIKHYTGGPIPCSVFRGCDTVTNSVYSAIGGIPIALFGALFYLVAMALAIAYWQTGQKILIKTLWVLSFLAFLASLFLVYLQIFVIKELCQYCMISALTSTLVFVSATLSFRRASTTSVAA